MTRAHQRIGILTGGGDVPGLNSVIKSVVYRATELGYEVFGIRRGWEGLTHMQPGARAGPRLRPSRSTGPTRGPSTGPAARCSTPRARTRARCGRRALPPWLDRRERQRRRPADGRVRPDAASCSSNIAAARASTTWSPIGGDDTLSFAPGPGRRGRPAHRHPQDDGQRRPGHRVLHRLLDGHHPGQGARSTASGRRSARTSGSACSGSSAATPASPPCTRPT